MEKDDVEREEEEENAAPNDDQARAMGKMTDQVRYPSLSPL